MSPLLIQSSVYYSYLDDDLLKERVSTQNDKLDDKLDSNRSIESYLELFKSGFTADSVESWKDIGKEFTLIGIPFPPQMIHWLAQQSYEDVIEHYIYSNIVNGLESYFAGK